MWHVACAVFVNLILCQVFEVFEFELSFAPDWHRTRAQSQYICMTMTTSTAAADRPTADCRLRLSDSADDESESMPDSMPDDGNDVDDDPGAN